MDSKNKFNIQFVGLKEGEHEFTFEIGKSFFDHVEYDDLEDADIELELMLYKQPNMLTLCFGFVGTVDLLCDRCAEQFPYKLMTNSKLYVKFGQTNESDNEEIVVIPEKSSEIDISQYIYEFITLALPAKRVHKEGECNPEVLEHLEKMSSKEEKNDPRWDKLKELITEQ